MFTACRHCTVFSSSMSNFSLTITLGHRDSNYSKFTDENVEDQRSKVTLSKATQLEGGLARTPIQICLMDPRLPLPLASPQYQAPRCVGGGLLGSSPTSHPKSRIQQPTIDPCAKSESTQHWPLHSMEMPPATILP